MNNLNKYILGDLVSEISERITNPSESGYDKFVGLEHLDSGSLHVKKWGSTQDVKSAMKLFKKGDILFARRNTYLKRASIASFDGVCSGDIIVLRAIDGSINGIAPIIMNSDKFWDFTISNSAGTMSKRAKWRDISKFEVYLPSVQKIEEYINCIYSLEKLINSKYTILEKSEKYKAKLLDKIVYQGIENEDLLPSEIGFIPKAFSIVSVSDMIEEGIIERPMDGNHGAIHPTVKDYVSDGIPFIMANDIKEGKIDLLECKFISDDTAKGLVKGFAKMGDVLLTHKGTIGNTAIVPKLSKQYIVLTPQVTYYRVIDNTRLDNKYLKYYFDTNKFQYQFKKLASGGTRLYLGIVAQQKLKIVLPPINIQRNIVEIVSNVDNFIENVKLSIYDDKVLKNKIIEKLI